MRSIATYLLCLLVAVGVQAQSPYLTGGFKRLDTEAAVLTGQLESDDKLGSAFANLGPVGTAGTVVAVGARGDDYTPGGLTNSGAIWLFQINPGGAILTIGKIGAESITDLITDSNFGESITVMDDLDGDGVPELAVGAPFDADGRGAVYIVSVHASGTLKSWSRIANLESGFPDVLDTLDRFGSSVQTIGDLDGNGVRELVVGAPQSGADDIGALYVLFMRSNGTIGQYRKVDETDLVLSGSLGAGNLFGWSQAFLGDISGTGREVLAVGAPAAVEGKTFLLSFTATGIPNLSVELDASLPALSQLEAGDGFGFSMANIGDLSGDGVPELAVGAVFDDDAEDGVGTDIGAVYILELENTGLPKFSYKISDTEGQFNTSLSSAEFFASAVGSPGDIDGDGINDLLIGSRNKYLAGTNTGTFYLIRNDYCRVARNRNVVISSDSIATFSWDPVPNAAGYKRQIRTAASTSGWQSSITTAVFDLDTLDPGETYDWRIFTGCGNTFSYASSREDFLIPPLRIGAQAEMVIYPNPISAESTLTLYGVDSPVLIRLYDMSGRLINSRRLDNLPNTWTMSISELADLAPGTYTLEAEYASGRLTEKIVKH